MFCHVRKPQPRANTLDPASERLCPATRPPRARRMCHSPLATSHFCPPAATRYTRKVDLHLSACIFNDIHFLPGTKIGFLCFRASQLADRGHSRMAPSLRFVRAGFCSGKFYLAFWSEAGWSPCSSALRQDESGSYSLMVLTSSAVFSPRSFSYTVPSWLTTNVMTPVSRYSAG
jgi:hypothetical protein